LNATVAEKEKQEAGSTRQNTGHNAAVVINK
jgi:hypothetical protein